MKEITVFVDGACFGNPGPGGIGVAFYEGKERGIPIRSLSEPLSQTTNNVAEYSALIVALHTAINYYQGETILVLSDSQLVVEQVNGNWAVNDPKMVSLCREATHLFNQLPFCTIRHINREDNTVADALAQKAVRKGIRNEKKGRQMF